VLGFGGKAPPPIGGELRVTGVMTPWPGEGFAWQGYRIEVVDMDVNRVNKVLVTRLAAVAT
jgi:hypothetical protein